MSADLDALLNKGYKVHYFGYDTKTVINIFPPKPDADPAKAYANRLEWEKRKAVAHWNAGLKVGWKEAPIKTVDFLKLLKTGTKQKFLAGIVLGGHGGSEGLLLNANVKTDMEAKDYYVTYDAWQKSQTYKLSIGILYACFTSEAQSAARVAKGTNVFSTIGIFWGATGVLIPPLAPPAVSKILRKLPSIRIGEETATAKPPSVATILKGKKEIE